MLSFGQPILVGHHSEAGTPPARRRVRSATERAVAAQQAAAQARDRATPAAAGTGARYNPVTVANRVKELTARQQAEQVRTGTAGDYGPHSIHAGDLVMLRRRALQCPRRSC